jgi:endoglucanase
VHNYAAYPGRVIGTHSLPPSAFADLWRRIAQRYKDNDTVIFGLMNEPHGFPTETWLATVKMAIAEIRRIGAKNLILVRGNGWSSARKWDGASFEVMLKVEGSC